LIENWGFIFKNGSRNFQAKLKRVNGFDGKIRSLLRIKAAACLE